MTETNGRLEAALEALTRQQAETEARFAENARQLAALMQLQATLMQNQVAFLSRAEAHDARLAEMDRRIEERFRRIEVLLIEHNRMLQALPDAVREKIGFKAAGA